MRKLSGLEISLLALPVVSLAIGWASIWGLDRFRQEVTDLKAKAAAEAAQFQQVKAKQDELSKALGQAQAELNFSRQAVADAQLGLVAAKDNLSRFEQDGSKVHLKAASMDIQSVEQALRSSSVSLGQLAQSSSAEGDHVDQWFAVVASYDPTENGMRRSIGQASELAKTGKCAEVWHSSTDKYAVVLTGVHDEVTALSLATEARTNGIAQDAYVRANTGWKILAQSPRCATAGSKATK